MTTEALTIFMIDYAFEKHRVKHHIDDELVTQHLKLEYAREWLDNAANRITQLKVSTHAAKYTNGNSRSSSFFKTTGESTYLSTGFVDLQYLDITGNSAVFDVAKMVMELVDGQSLMGCIKNRDFRAFERIAKNSVQLKQWVDGFSSIWIAGDPKSHKLAKQIYFPVGDDYHLLSPLFATSLAHMMHEKLIAARFSEEAKEARDAHRAGKWHPQPDVRYPNLAEMHFGGTKPQNISALNSSRGGRVWLLPSQPPGRKDLNKPPQAMSNLFALSGAFTYAASGVVKRMVYLLKENADKNNHRIRNLRAAYVDELIDLLFLQATTYQQENWQGWTLNNPDLPFHQQLWLDPWRSKTDEVFRLEREKGDWKADVADDFARWLNRRLNKARLEVGIVERREWRTQRRFSQRMREMEAIVQEALK